MQTTPPTEPVHVSDAPSARDERFLSRTDGTPGGDVLALRHALDG